MLEQIIQAGQAMAESGSTGQQPLEPALCGCVACGVVRMIASPVLGLCQECGEELGVLSGDEARTQRLEPVATVPWAA
jgi:hypothetical protein